MSEKLVTLYHPDIPDVSYEKPESVVDAWVASGWLKSPPKNAAVKAARQAAESAE